MKKIILTLAGSLLISLTVVNAQQVDTTRTRTKQHQYGTQDQDSRTQWRSEDRQTVTRGELPDALVQTLNSSEYRGWENATIYRNKKTDEYMLIISDGDQPQTLYFDRNGKALNRGTGTSGTGTSGTTGTTGTDKSGTDKYGTGTSGTTGTDKSGKDKYGTGTTGTGTTGTGTTQDQNQTQMQWRSEDRIVVPKSEIPSSLRQTLRGDQYKGWENSTLYRNRTTNEYMVEIGTSTNKKSYYFDRNGKAISNSPTQGTRDDQ